MKIAILIPDRGDRPLFLKNCLRMLDIQIREFKKHEDAEFIIEIVKDEPLNDDCDITWRYRIGYNRLRNKNIDIIALIENDDWYSPEYLHTMVYEWKKSGKPDLFGTNYTIYYHIKMFKYFTMEHDDRSSAMSTLIRPDLDFKWCVDIDPFTDLHIWKTLKGVLFTPKNHICLGIKHGIGKCGGSSHLSRLERYIHHGIDDSKKWFLRENMDSESFKFYSEYFSDEILQLAKQDVASINL